MNEAEPGVNVEPDEWIKWSSWRGSPQLVAHVARTAIKAAGGAQECEIRVEVNGDIEFFATPDAFTTDVTPEALRDFRAIHITVRNQVGIDIRFFRRPPHIWKGPIWPLASDRELPDQGVLLQLVNRKETTTPNDATKAINSVFEAINRGRTHLGAAPVRRSRELPTPPKRRHTREDTLVFLAVAASTTLAFAAALLLTNALTGGALQRASNWVRRISPHWIRTGLGNFPDLVAVFAIGIVAGLSSAWVRPPIEVAEPGQTRLRHVLKYAGGLLVTLALAAFSKKILNL